MNQMHRNPRRSVSAFLLGATMLLAAGNAPVAAQAYQFKTLYSVVYDNVTSAGDQILSPSINNARNVLWAGQTQDGPRVFRDSPANNLAAAVANSDTIIDTRLPRFGTNTTNAVWDGLTGEIDPATGLAKPDSNYQEDRIYLNKNGSSSIIGKTQFVPGAFSSPDVNDAGQAVFRRLDYNDFTWSLYAHDGSGNLSGTSVPLSGYYSIGTTFINAGGNAAFFGRATAADTSRLTIYNLASGTLSYLASGATPTGASLLDYSDDGRALLFSGNNSTGSYYVVDKNGTVTQVLTAGTQGTTRLQLGAQNSKGQFVFANRTVLATSGTTPSYGQSDLELYDNGNLIRLTNDLLGTVIGSAGINDNGDVSFVTQKYLYDANGNYLNKSEYDLVVGMAAPEPGPLAFLIGLVVPGALLLKPRRKRSI